jgi:putative DNA primase/helicase
MSTARRSLADEAELRRMLDDTLGSTRLLMLGKGYVPLPASDKGVFLRDWSKLDENGNQCGVNPTVEEIDRWSVEHPDWQSTSVRCGEVVAIDCDILDKAVADKVREEARRCFGKAFPTRVGNPPKFLMMCRTPEPFSKLRTGKYLQPDGGTSQVEVLCRGQQFIAFGIHPKTGKPYGGSVAIR